MDNYGLLNLSRQLGASLTALAAEKHNAPKKWAWAATPVIMPESKCPFCLQPIRSRAIWFLSGENHERLMGILKLDSEKVELVHPNHPHNTGGGYLCLGKNADGIALLASTPNILDAPMGVRFIPKWLKRYWDHPCVKAREYLLRSSEFIELLREYDKL